MSKPSRRKARDRRPGKLLRGRSRENLDGALQLAVEHFQAERFPAAEARCHEILAAEPKHPVALHLLGVIARFHGANTDAVELLRKAVAAAPNNAKAFGDLGGAYFDLARYDEAARAHAKAAALEPKSFAPLMNHGNAEHAAGRPHEALKIYRAALKREPRLAGAYVNIASVHQELGDRELALKNYRRAIELQPSMDQAHAGLGQLLVESGKDAEAQVHFEVALSENGDNGTALNALGELHLRAGRWDGAINCFGQLTQMTPALANAWGNLGLALYHRGDWEAALDALQNTVNRDPMNGAAWFTLGDIHHALGRHDDALKCFEKAIELRSHLVKAHNNLGFILLNNGQLPEAISSFEKALEFDPNFPEALNNLGNARRELGELQGAERLYRAAIEQNPKFAMAHSNILLTIHSRSGMTLGDILETHQDWAARYAAPLRQTWPKYSNDKAPERRLKIGLVSADLGAHPVGYFTIGFVENHDPDDMQITCYSGRQPDAWTERFMSAAEYWVDTRRMNDEALAARITADGIDILFDLSGHTSNNRMMVFARKPAPVQISWAGYPSTTGMDAIDYLITDPISTDPGEDAYFVETPIRLPNAFVNYTPPEDAPPIISPPCLAKAHATFGCFSNPSKINSELLKCWADVMRDVPGSMLRLEYKSLDAEANRSRITSIFRENGIADDRLLFGGKKQPEELLYLYNEIDIAFDTFPYSGGATICEIIWMGVPVLTRPGETFASRHGASLLAAAGLSEFIYEDKEALIAATIELANDKTALTKLRSVQRERVRNSPLCDSRRFSKDLSREIRNSWRTWCVN